MANKAWACVGGTPKLGGGGTGVLLLGEEDVVNPVSDL